MPLASHTRGATSSACVVAAIVLACSVTSATETLQPFSTDGCSRFPDRAPNGRSDWCRCCVIHDFAYWRGGTPEERLLADLDLKSCVNTASGSEALAEAMFLGVRAGGGPQFHTPYRWGYGWPVGRLYKQLTAEEEAMASALEQEYRAKDPLLSCPSEANPHRQPNAGYPFGRADRVRPAPSGVRAVLRRVEPYGQWGSRRSLRHLVARRGRNDHASDRRSTSRLG